MTLTLGPLMIGLDVGTTSTKAAAYDRAGTELASVKVPTPTAVSADGRAEHDPTLLWRGICGALRKVTAQISDPRSIVSVAVSSFGEAGVPLDGHGEPLYNIMAWYDQRAVTQAEHLRRTHGVDRIGSLTGIPVDASMGVPKLLWLAEHEPEIFGATRHWLNVADYIAYRLSGTMATDLSLASRTLALDLNGRRWAVDFLQDIGLGHVGLADLTLSGTSLGTVLPAAAEATGLPTSCTVAAGGQDHICGAYACGISSPQDVLFGMGTAEIVYTPTDGPQLESSPWREGYSQGFDTTGTTYLFGGLPTSGAAVDWARELFASSSAGRSPATTAAVEERPLFFPYLRFMGAPLGTDPSSGAFSGLSPTTTTAHLYRCVLEGISFASRQMLEGMSKHGGNSGIARAYAIGGSTRNRELMDIKAAVLGRPIRTDSASTEASSLGAALLGGIGAGVTSRSEPSQTSNIRWEVTRPDRSLVQVYDALYQRYCDFADRISKPS